MFAVATPQTVKLPDNVTITFRTDGDDTSKCAMDIMVDGGDIHTVFFNTRGHIVSQGTVHADDVAQDELEAEPPTADYGPTAKTTSALTPSHP